MHHTFTPFENALRDARGQVLRMASLAERNLETALNGLLTRSTELCNEAIADDDEVNAIEKRIDADCYGILMRYNPVATDLRQVIAGMRVANNLERVSDEAHSIARSARKILKYPELSAVNLIEPVYAEAVGMLRDGMRAFAEGDIALALSLYDRDKELDKLHSNTIKEFTKLMDRESANVKVCLHLIFIVRSLERVGDHAVNIGQDGIFLESAADVRHLGPVAAAERIARNEPAARAMVP